MKLRDLVTSSLPRVISRKKRQQQQQQFTPGHQPLLTREQQKEHLEQGSQCSCQALWTPACPQPNPPQPCPPQQQPAGPASPSRHLQAHGLQTGGQGPPQWSCQDHSPSHQGNLPPGLPAWGGSGGHAGLGCGWGGGGGEACHWGIRDPFPGGLHLYGTLNIRVAAPLQSCLCVCCRQMLSCLAGTDRDDNANTLLAAGGVAEEQEEEEEEEEERLYSAAPKTRSRIRTNPWLPSPRLLTSDLCPLAPGPSSSGGDLPLGHAFRDPVLRGRGPHHSAPSQGIYSVAGTLRSPSPSPPSSPSDNNSLSEFQPPDVTSSCDVTSSDCVMETDQSRASSGTTDHDAGSTSRSTEGSSEGKSVSDQPLLLGNMNDLSRRPGFHSSAWDTDTSTDLSPIFESVENKLGALEQNISFEYEEALDSTLERGSVRREDTHVSLQELLEEEEEATRDAAVQTEFDSSEDSDWVAQEGEPISSEDCSSDLPCSDPSVAARRDCMQDSVDTGYFSLTRDGQAELDEDFHYFKAQHLVPHTSSFSETVVTEEFEFKTFPHHVKTRSGRLLVCESPRHLLSSSEERQEAAAGSGRKLAEVRSSLEEKLRQLREDKALMERKMWEAREEERLREEQRQRFQTQANLHRKQVLLETLRDLRTRLEDQGDRLQSSYSAVLAVQHRFAQRRSPLAALAAASLT